MKAYAFLTLLSCFFHHFIVLGQSAVSVTGVVKSHQGAIQGAEVEFLNLKGEFQGNCVSGPNGKFTSENPMAIGRTIKIKVSKAGYESLEVRYRIGRSGKAGEFMIKRKLLALSGFVKDSISETPVQNAEISFYKESVLVQSSSTNATGYFDLETDFTYGQKITIRISKLGYHEKEQTLTFTTDGRNSLPDILLPQHGDRGLRAFIRIKDKKKNKAISGAIVSYFDSRKSAFIDTITSSKGELDLKLYQRPGTILDLKISKPNYRAIQDKRILSEDPLLNEFKYELIRDRNSAPGNILLAGGGLSLLVSGAAFINSTAKYNDYKDFKNSNRESDFNAAQNMRTISAIAGGITAAAVIGYIAHKINQKKQERAREQAKNKASL